MSFTIGPDSLRAGKPEAHPCGLCGHEKSAHEYSTVKSPTNAYTTPVSIRVKVYLCNNCDLNRAYGDGQE